jgi:hypothetical protein
VGDRRASASDRLGRVQPQGARLMTSLLAADSIVSICGALGLFVAIATVRRRDPTGPLTQRITFALGLVAALFLIRGASWWANSDGLERLALCLASILPLAALVLTESVLRRHAPEAMKVAVSAGAILLAIAALFDVHRLLPATGWLLASFQLATFAACAMMIFLRQHDSLAAVENFGLVRLAVGGLIVVPFLLSDYRDLFPFVPVKLGALGSLLIVTTMLFEGEEARQRSFLLLGVRIFGGLVLGGATAFIEKDVSSADIVRFAAITVSGVLVIGLVVDLTRSALISLAPGLLASIAVSPAAGRGALLEQLSKHPLFATAQRLRTSALVDYDPPILSPALDGRSVLRQADYPWQLSATNPAAERLFALMATYSASHLVVIENEPLDLLLLSVPVVSADPATETALLLVRRILAASPAEAT